MKISQASVEKAEELSTLLLPELQRRQNIIHFPSSPWQHSRTQERQIAPTVPGITVRADGFNLKRQCSLTTIASYQADYVIYTKGSASRGTRNGGAAAVITRESPLQPQVVTTIKTKERTFTSSNEEEAAAISQHYHGHQPTPTILQSPYSLAQTANPYVKLSFHQIHVPFQFIIPLTPYRLLSSFGASLSILPFQVTI